MSSNAGSHSADQCSVSGLLPVDAAIARLLECARPVPDTEQVPLSNASGRVLAVTVVSPVNVPPADNSAMDGYALSTEDLLSGQSCVLPVSQRIPAGAVSAALLAGTCARIFTGAELPPGANAVVMQEKCVVEGDVVRFPPQVKAGDNIRPAGNDIRLGDVVIDAGTRLSPIHAGLLASVGLGTITVFRRPRVGIFSTGDELVEPGHPLASGQIYNSNRYLLRALLEQAGCEVLDAGVSPDSADETKNVIRTLVQGKPDVIFSTGGVSVGEEDHVKAVIESLGRIDFWKIAIKPGKPLAFGEVQGIPYFGLPGNPQSALITFMVLARPWLLRTAGQENVLPVVWRLPAGFIRGKVSDRQEYLRARLENGVLVLHSNQSSGALSSAAWADGLVVLPAGRTVVAGDPVDFLPFQSAM